MKGEYCIGVVIPAKNEEHFIRNVVETLPHFVDLAVIINDGSTDKTQVILDSMETSVEMHCITLGGEGVGAAIDAGHQYLLSHWPNLPFISVVMAGDGQMNPNDMEALLQPVVENRAEYSQGNRFSHHLGIENMPKIRRIASRILSFFTGLASGQVTPDPQCGYTATHHEVLNEWKWADSWKGYGYPNFWLIRLSALGFRIVHIPVESIYGEQKTGIRRLSFFAKVGLMMAYRHHQRNISWLFSSRVTPHTIFATIAYVIGWIALLPGISTDLERELVGRGIAPVFITIIAWLIAHVFDRGATRTVRELRLSAKARQKA
ncbi:MAG: glycosyltransferase family 2 protein [Euryarchaeota archaeon]|nr:glycosyltransferase family 2 protein [Euryarchaeota archaeon]MBT7064307.1 glycosyltransferase family 2 protein [Euryarchaeota archaeon]MBT7262603.1 glycosyltransferase family 2 protein [Euryarchaeota archaeon]